MLVVVGNVDEGWKDLVGDIGWGVDKYVWLQYLRGVSLVGMTKKWGTNHLLFCFLIVLELKDIYR